MYDAVADDYRCTSWADPGCGPALKKKGQQLADVSDKLPGLEEIKRRKRGREESERMRMMKGEEW